MMMVHGPLNTNENDIIKSANFILFLSLSLQFFVFTLTLSRNIWHSMSVRVWRACFSNKSFNFKIGHLNSIPCNTSWVLFVHILLVETCRYSSNKQTKNFYHLWLFNYADERNASKRIFHEWMCQREKFLHQWKIRIDKNEVINENYSGINQTKEQCIVTPNSWILELNDSIYRFKWCWSSTLSSPLVNRQSDFFLLVQHH